MQSSDPFNAFEFLEILRSYRMDLSIRGETHPGEAALIHRGQRQAHTLMLLVLRQLIGEESEATGI